MDITTVRRLGRAYFIKKRRFDSRALNLQKKREGIFPSLKVIAIESYLPQCFMRVSPIAEGVGDTAMPASSRALILSSAEPEFPETIAPA